MPDCFRALAIDYSQTITVGARPDESVLGAIGELRAGGRAIVLEIREVLRDHELAKAVGRTEASFAIHEAGRFRTALRELIGLRHRLDE